MTDVTENAPIIGKTPARYKGLMQNRPMPGTSGSGFTKFDHDGYDEHDCSGFVTAAPLNSIGCGVVPVVPSWFIR